MSLPTLETTRVFSNKVITRILGFNPSSYTLQGTNTYLVNLSPERFVLLDTAEGKPEYVPELKAAISHQKGELTDIILSHYHHDHVQGLPDVLRVLKELGRPLPKVWKWPLQAEHEGTLKTYAEALRIYPGFEVSPLSAGQTFTADKSLSLEVLHSPGHTFDSITLYSPELNLIFTADTILGHGTAVFESFKHYLATLNELLKKTDRQTTLYPAHGEVIEKGQEKIHEYIEHRMLRVRQVVEVLSRNSELSAYGITKEIYADTIPQSVYPGAVRGILLILDKLQHDGLVRLTDNSEFVVSDDLTALQKVAQVPWSLTSKGLEQVKKEESHIQA